MKRKLYLIFSSILMLFLITSCKKTIYEVTFDKGNGSEVVIVEVVKNKNVTKPDNPEKEGYVFVYWELDGEEFVFENKITKNITLNAVWETKKYKVSFDTAGGSNIADVEVNHNERVSKPNIPIKEGYAFDHWSFNEEPFNFNDFIVENVTLTAVWVKEYVVTYDLGYDGLTTTINIHEDKSLPNVYFPKRAGYVFVSWLIDGSEYDFSEKVNKNLTLTAKWEKEHQVKIDYDIDGVDNLVFLVKNNDKLTEPKQFEKEGYSFKEWQIDGVKFSFETTITKNVTIKAIWEKNQYDLELPSGVSSTKTTQIEHNSDVLLTISVPANKKLLNLFVNGINVVDDVRDFEYQFSIKKDTLVVVEFVDENLEVVKVDFDLGDNLSNYLYIEKGGNIVNFDEPTKARYRFLGWTLNNVNYNVETIIDNDISLVAKWGNDEEALIYEDYLLVLEGFLSEKFLINMPTSGPLNRSVITWQVNHNNIAKTGVIIPLDRGENPQTVEIKANFRIGTVTKQFIFEATIYPYSDTVLEASREIEFKNLTSEYTLEDKLVTLYFEEGSYVPYIKVTEFFALLEGFIDPIYNIQFTKSATELKIEYEYYDEEEDYVYDLVVIIDLSTNTITTTDPGFYWAYVKQTETNYGRHIYYDRENKKASYLEGTELVFNLSDYNLNITMYENEIVLPFYLANQLFAGSSYYNVYYNYDGLYGVYSLPESGSDEYNTIKTSSLNNTNLSSDILLHTYNMLAFNLDYFYGLKDLKEIETFYDLLYSNKDKLLTTNPQSFDNELSRIILKEIDELHTSFGYPSYYNRRTWDGPQVISVATFGPNVQMWYNDGLYAVNDSIEAKWGREGLASNAWAAGSKNRDDYWFLDNKHAVLILDSFRTADIEESLTYNKEIVDELLKVNDSKEIFPEIIGGNKYFYYKNSDNENIQIETIVKGLSQSYLNEYKQKLIALGYELVKENTTDEFKEDGYYKLTKGEETYFLITRYEPKYNLFYVGIGNKEIPANYSKEWQFNGDVISLVKSDSAVYLELAIENMLKEKPSIESITLDLTWNTGGNVGALYRVLGFITKDPFMVTNINKATGSASSSFVYIDGVPNYDYLEWSLLISPVTFSAANSMATIFKENKLGKIIGIKSSGGTASITPVLLPNGTAFTMSSNSLSAFRRGEGTEEDPYLYLDNEQGITPDHILNVMELYNIEKLLNFLNN